MRRFFVTWASSSADPNSGSDDFLTAATLPLAVCLVFSGLIVVFSADSSLDVAFDFFDDKDLAAFSSGVSESEEEDVDDESESESDSAESDESFCVFGFFCFSGSDSESDDDDDDDDELELSASALSFLRPKWE